MFIILFVCFAFFFVGVTTPNQQTQPKKTLQKLPTPYKTGEWRILRICVSLLVWWKDDNIEYERDTEEHIEEQSSVDGKQQSIFACYDRWC